MCMQHGLPCAALPNAFHLGWFWETCRAIAVCLLCTFLRTLAMIQQGPSLQQGFCQLRLQGHASEAFVRVWKSGVVGAQ